MGAAACSQDEESVAWLSKKEDEGTQEEKVDGHITTSVSGCCNKLKRKLLPPHIRTESKALIKLAWGISLNSFLTFFIPVSSVLIVGHKGKVYLAALGLGLSVCNVTGSVFVAGLTSVTETLCSQAYGAGQYKQFGVVIQRSLILTFLAVLPSCALWINLDKLLVLLGQDKEVAKLASYYGICFIPGLLCQILFNILTRFLACQNIVYPTVFGSLLAFVVNGVFCYVFVYELNFGIWGAAFALDLAYFSFCVFNLTFIYVKKIHEKTWYGWSRECLSQWTGFFSLAIPATSMTLMEWIVYELAIILLGTIGNVEQAAMIVSLYIAGSIYFVSFGIAIGIAVRVGNFLGAGLPQYAKHSVKAGFLVSAAFTVSILLIVAATKDVIGYLFTSDRAVIEMVSDVIVLAASHQIFDGLQTICIGGIRGIGYQKYGALINFVGYICVGIPLYILLMFKANLGVLGFWIGAVAGVWSQLFGEAILLYRADWTELSKSARERAGVVTDARPFESDGPVVENYGATEKHVEENKYKSRSKVDDVTETAFIREDESSLFTPDFPSTVQGDHGVSSPHANAAEVFFTYPTTTAHSKLEIFVKVLVVSLLFILVIVSLVFRVIRP